MELEWVKKRINVLAEKFKQAGEDWEALSLEEEAYQLLVDFAVQNHLSISGVDLSRLTRGDTDWNSIVYELHRRFFEGELKEPVTLDHLFRILEFQFHGIDRKEFASA